MRVFVAGAAGAVGSRLVRLLIQGGHVVIGMTHRPDHAKLVAALGARPAVASAFDEGEIRAAVLVARPDVIVHEMTDLKDATDLKHMDRLMASTNRLRTIGTDHLISAARAARVRRIVAQSFCGWPYAPGGAPVKTEEDALMDDPPREMRGTLEAIRHLEKIVVRLRDRDFEGVVLRYGALYGPGTGIFEGGLIAQIRERRLPILGSGDGWWSFLHVEDAARATAIAVESGGAHGVYNVADDEPAPVRDWLPELALMLGAPPPRHVPLWIARLMAGDHLIHMMTSQRAGSNAKAKADLPWQPSRPSWRLGFGEVIEEMIIRQSVA